MTIRLPSATIGGAVRPVMRGVLTGWILLGACCVTAFAQAPAEDSRLVVAASVGGLASIQSGGYDGTGGPYLRNSLRGFVPGVVLALDVSAGRRALVAVELSSTTNMEALQSGRFVVGPDPVVATHRDTLLSVLFGGRVRAARAEVDLKAGFSLLFGTPEREGHPFDDPGGAVAFTTGVDVIVHAGNRLSVVPTVRYSIASRGDDAMYFGLGRHILRPGIALRVHLNSPE